MQPLKTLRFGCWVIFFVFSITACVSSPQAATESPIKVMAAESFLTDIAQQVAGERLHIDGLIPPGLEPHSYEPTPQDIARVADSDLLLISGAGLEGWLKNILTNIGGSEKISEASSGLVAKNGDPHFWLDPNNVLVYVDNIRDALIKIDPLGKDVYNSNAETYKQKLRELDAWIQQEVAKIPPRQRLLVTNHETLGYFADRYGFEILGSVLSSLSSEASPSAQQLAQLRDAMRAHTVKAIFLDITDNPQLAEQIAAETQAKVITDLYSEFLSPADGPASTYLEMMKHLVTVIVNALQ